MAGISISWSRFRVDCFCGSGWPILFFSSWCCTFFTIFLNHCGRNPLNVLQWLMLYGLQLYMCLENCDLYNYADDNTAGVCDRTPDEVCSGLERTAASRLHWFQINFIQGNLSKFQFMLFGKNREEYNVELAPDLTLVS